MPNLDRLSVGRSDSQADPVSMAACCAYEECPEIITPDDPCWVFDGKLYCTAVCFAKNQGAAKTAMRGERFS